MTEDMPDTEIRAAIGELTTGFQEVRQAILGDERLGHIGLVKRTRDLEALALEAPEVHRQIEDRATASIARVHTRLDEGQAAVDERIDEVEDTWRQALHEVERKIDRLIWMAWGAGLTGLALGGGGAWAILRGVPG